MPFFSKNRRSSCQTLVFACVDEETQNVDRRSPHPGVPQPIHQFRPRSRASTGDIFRPILLRSPKSDTVFTPRSPRAPAGHMCRGTRVIRFTNCQRTEIPSRLFNYRFIRTGVAEFVRIPAGVAEFVRIPAGLQTCDGILTNSSTASCRVAI